jgi:GNAT superfamily N-acetyltransferase
MMEEMRFEIVRMDSHNSSELLKSSLDEFYCHDEVGGLAFLSKYKKATDSREIISCKLLKNDREVSSCVLVRQFFLVNNHVVSGYFLTQVVTARNYRGNGYFRKLLSEVEKALISNDTQIIIVIARRAVRDFYSKLGFRGFSHFAEMVSLPPNPTLPFTGSRMAEIQDADMLSAIHKESSAYLYGKLPRTIEDWRLILQCQSVNSYRVWLPLGEKVGSYIIAKEKIGLEMGSTRSNQADKEFLERMISNLDKFYIDRSNALAQYFSEKGWVYNERFEAHEGHLIKLVSKVPPEVQMFFDEVVKKNGLFRLNIDPVDQW